MHACIVKRGCVYVHNKMAFTERTVYVYKFFLSLNLPYFLTIHTHTSPHHTHTSLPPHSPTPSHTSQNRFTVTLQTSNIPTGLTYQCVFDFGNHGNRVEETATHNGDQLTCPAPSQSQIPPIPAGQGQLCDRRMRPRLVLLGTCL